MTTPTAIKNTAFSATYSDWKLIKTRGVVQVVMEVPLSEADAAYQILGGMPDFSQERWFAVAPLKLPPAEKEIEQDLPSKSPATPSLPLDKPAGKAKRDWRDMQPSAQASMLCDKPVFQAFLHTEYPVEWRESMGDPDECVRLICCVSSKAMLNEGGYRVIWHQLNEQYDLWSLKDRVGV
jgi:hypothetical protein